MWTRPKHVLVLVTRQPGKWAPAGGPLGAWGECVGIRLLPGPGMNAVARPCCDAWLRLRTRPSRRTQQAPVKILLLRS